MNPFKILKYQLYLLQIENYEIGRYLKLLFRRGLLPSKNLRKELVWTMKAKGLFLMAFGLYIFLPIVIFWFFIPASTGMTIKIILLFTVYCLLLFLFFIFYILSLILIWPLDWTVKTIIILKAKSKVKNLPDLKVIGIAGSYGKTTMKEVVKTVLSKQYRVLSTPESVNTPVGIARWILKEVNALTNIIIVEMGEHYKGDVEYICRITPPDIAVVTGINEAHLERMKNMDTVVSTIFEVVSKSKAKSLIVLNGDDKNVTGHYKEFIWPDHKPAVYGRQNQEVLARHQSELQAAASGKIMNYEFNSDKLSWQAEFKDLGDVEVNLLGEYAVKDVEAAIIIAKYLNMENEDIKKGIEKIKPVPHRLQPIQSPEDVLVIDDAYNGNSDGAREAIKVLAKFKDRRKIYITPGLVESGKKSQDIHREIGKRLAGKVDVVILIRNSVTQDIESGIKNYESRTKPKIIWFETAHQAHSSLKSILQPRDVVLFQNDWGDQYL